MGTLGLIESRLNCARFCCNSFNLCCKKRNYDEVLHMHDLTSAIYRTKRYQLLANAMAVVSIESCYAGREFCIVTLHVFRGFFQSAKSSCQQTRLRPSISPRNFWPWLPQSCMPFFVFLPQGNPYSLEYNANASYLHCGTRTLDCCVGRCQLAASAMYHDKLVVPGLDFPPLCWRLSPARLRRQQSTCWHLFSTSALSKTVTALPLDSANFAFAKLKKIKPSCLLHKTRWSLSKASRRLSLSVVVLRYRWHFETRNQAPFVYSRNSYW